MTIFGERFKELRIAFNKTQKELADIFCLNYSSISKYETGKAIPEHSLLIDIANYFDVSVDYLIGRTNIMVNKVDENQYIFEFKNGKRKASKEELQIIINKYEEFVDYALKIRRWLN